MKILISVLSVVFFISTSAHAEGGLSRRSFLQSLCGLALSGAAYYYAPQLNSGDGNPGPQNADAIGSVDWKIEGRAGRVIASGNADVFETATAGSVTIEFLKAAGVKYQGTEAGILSIDGTPTGDDAIEVLSDTKMRVYGWCYEVNGVTPDVMPDKFAFKEGASRLRWFYAYSLYENGEWVSYCNPAP